MGAPTAVLHYIRSDASGQLRGLAAEPLFVNLLISARLDGAVKALVDFVKELLVALGDGNAEVLFFKARIAALVEGLVRILLDVPLQHAHVADHGVDAAVGKLFERKRRVVKAPDVG